MSVRVSVLINNRNYGHFLPYCIESVLDQTRSADEIIVYDDDSDDDSLRILGRYANRLRVVEGAKSDQPPAFRQARAISMSFNESSGEIVCLLDADDAFTRKKLARVVDAFTTRPNLVMVQHPFYEIDDKNVRKGIVRPTLKKVEPASYIRKTNNLLGIYVQTSGLSFARSYLEAMLPIVADEYDALWADVRLTRPSSLYGQVALSSPRIQTPTGVQHG